MRDGLPWSSLRGKADISYFHVLVLNRRMRIRMFGGVGGVSMLPLPDCYKHMIWYVSIDDLLNNESHSFLSFMCMCFLSKEK